MSSINNAFNIDYPNNLVQIKPCQKLTGVSRISVN